MILTPTEISHLKEQHRRIRNAVWHGEMQEPSLPDGFASGAAVYVAAARANGFYVHRLYVKPGKEPNLYILFTAEILHPDINDDKTLENAATILEKTLEPSTHVFDFLLASATPEGIAGELPLPEPHDAIAPTFRARGMQPIRSPDSALRFEERVAVQAAEIIGDIVEGKLEQRFRDRVIEYDLHNHAEGLLLSMQILLGYRGLADSQTSKILDKVVSERRYDVQTVDALVARFSEVQVRRIEQHADQLRQYFHEHPSHQGAALMSLNEGTHPVLYEELKRAGISYVSVGPRYEHPLRTHLAFVKTTDGIDWFFALDAFKDLARILSSKAAIVMQHSAPEIVQPAERGRYARVDVQKQLYRVPEGDIDVILESTRQQDGARRADLTVRVPRTSAVVEEIAQYMR